MKYNTFFACLMLISTTLFSQSKKYVYYFNSDLQLTDKNKSVYNGTGVIKNGLLEFTMYDGVNNNLLLVAHYKDSSLQVSHGLFQFYYDNGLFKKEVNYENGKEHGLLKQWDSLGRITDSVLYNYGEKIMEVNAYYHKNGRLSGFIVNDIKSDRLDKTYYDANGRITSEANFIGQKGIIKYYDSTMNGRIDTVYTREEIEASFPGGERAWTLYIKQQIEKNIDALIKDNKSGTCRVKFIVDKDGNTKNAEALTMQGSKLAKIAVNAVLKGPKWIPASQYGRKVNAFREQPVTFSVQQ